MPPSCPTHGLTAEDHCDALDLAIEEVKALQRALERSAVATANEAATAVKLVSRVGALETLLRRFVAQDAYDLTGMRALQASAREALTAHRRSKEEV